MSTSLPPDPSYDRNAEFVAALSAAYSRLLGYIKGLLGRRQEADDVLQRACLVMWQKFVDFEPGSDSMARASTICY